MKKTLFALLALALVVASLAGGAAFLLRQKHLQEMGRLAKQAEDKLEVKSYDQAISMLRKVEAEGGTDRSTFLLGRAFSEQGKYEEAGRYYEELLKKYPKSALVADTRLALARYHLKVTKDDAEAQKQLLDILKYWPKSDSADFALVLLADISLKKGDEAQGRKNLELVLRKKDSPAKDEAEFLIGDLNMKRLKAPTAAPGEEVYTIKAGDTLNGLTKKLKVPQDLLMGINNITDPKTLRIGQELRVPHLNISLVIDKAKRTLTIKNGSEFLKKYRVGINQDDSALKPKVYSAGTKHDKGMDYAKPGTNEVIKAGAPTNPYGNRYIELGGSAGIHGTNDPSKIGKLVSDGIVVMSNQDIEEVYALVQSKTQVTVKNSVNAEARPAN